MGKRNKMAVKNKRKNNNNKKKTHFSRRRYAGCWIDDFLLALSNWFFLAASSFPPLSSSSRWFSSKHACSISVALTNLSQIAQMLAAQNAKPLERRAEGNFWKKNLTKGARISSKVCTMMLSCPKPPPPSTNQNVGRPAWSLESFQKQCKTCYSFVDPRALGQAPLPIFRFYFPFG